jgi:hypothetical protein
MKNAFQTIDTNALDTITGGAGRWDAARRAGQWAWNNVAKPVGAGAAWEAASRWLGGGSGTSPQQAQPAPGQ